MSDDLQKFLDERNDAFDTLDLDWARKQEPDMKDWTDHQVLIAMHKARHHCLASPDDLRIESAKWLKANGYGDMHMQPIDDPTVLPK